MVLFTESDVVVPDKGGKSSGAVRETLSVLAPFFIFTGIVVKILFS